MKYAIYDKAADGYLTKMEFEVGYSEHTQFECGLNEYITEAKFLDTKEEAADVIARIESFKFMEKGRFVIHSFDETLGYQYIISEAGNPTKVVDNITIDLDGTINVKYGVMSMHWSCSHLSYAVNRLDRLQEASSPKYGAWRCTFDIYKVITITDERSCTHYQFINVTEKCLDFEKEDKKNLVVGKNITDITDPLNKRIETLEAKVESIKKEARNWKNLYDNADTDRSELKDWIDFIYNDLKSAPDCDDLKGTLDALKLNTKLNHIYMPTKASYILDKGDALTAKDELYAIVDTMITIMESRELNKNDDTSTENAGKYHTAIANDIIDICKADDKFEVTLEKFSLLYDAIYVPMAHDDVIMHAFKCVLEIVSYLGDKVRKIIEESVEWKFKAQTAEKALDDRKKLNKANVDTISRLADEKRDMNKEIKELRTMRDCLAEIIHAIRNAICDNNSGAFDCIESRMIHDSDFNSSPFMAGARENIKDICDAGKKLNYADTDIITQMDDKLRDMVKESNRFHDNRNRLVSVIYDIRNAIYNKDSDALCRINDSIIHDVDFDADLAMTSAGGNLRDICNACYLDIQNNELKNSEIARLSKERDKALERAEFYKRQANSVYGMTIPCRCNGKQMFYDVTTGKKILVGKEKYDDLVKYVADINFTYDNDFCMMDKPVYLSAITEALNDLTK